jgi:hypothetical protein
MCVFIRNYVYMFMESDDSNRAVGQREAKKSRFNIARQVRENLVFGISSSFVRYGCRARLD